jgi:beta-N-acetylhexosaminidase
MEAAGAGGDHVARARAAASAGCDMLLICNNRPAASTILPAFRDHRDPATSLRLLRMHGRKALDRVRLHESPEWHRALGHIAELESHDSLELPLEDPTIPEPRTER